MDSIGQQPTAVNLFNTDPTVCRICSRRYDMQQTSEHGSKPKLLPGCGHTFCEKCIRLQTTGKPSKPLQVICCPTCQTKTSLETKSGIDRLPINYAIVDLIERDRAFEPRENERSNSCTMRMFASRPSKTSNRWKPLARNVMFSINSMEASQVQGQSTGESVRCQSFSGTDQQTNGNARPRPPPYNPIQESLYPALNNSTDPGFEDEMVTSNEFLNEIPPPAYDDVFDLGAAPFFNPADTVPWHNDRNRCLSSNVPPLRSQQGNRTASTTHRSCSSLDTSIPPSNGIFQPLDQTESSMISPSRMCISSSGSLLAVVDELSNNIHMFSSDGHCMARFKVVGVTGCCFFDGDDVLAVATQSGIRLHNSAGHLLQELPVGHVLNTVNYGNGSFVGVQSRHLSIYASREGGCVLVKTLTRKTKQAGLLKKRVLVPFEQIVDVATTNTDLVILEMTSSAQNAVVSVTDENGFLKTTIDNKTTHGCLLNPFAVVVDISRNIYVSDRNAGKILKYSSVGLYAGCFATSDLLPSTTMGTRKCFVFGLAIDNLKNQMFAIVRGNGAAEIRVYQL